MLLGTKGNIKRELYDLKYSRNTVYLALEKESQDKAPKTPSEEVVELIVKGRKQAGFGKRRLMGQILPFEKLEAGTKEITNKKLYLWKFMTMFSVQTSSLSGSGQKLIQ